MHLTLNELLIVRFSQVPGKPSPQMRFFKSEYLADLSLALASKPVVSLIDGVNLLSRITIYMVIFYIGITMGGGVGISIHGLFRVATERTIIAMPETGSCRVLHRYCLLCGSSHFL